MTTILIVDDEETNIEFLEVHLQDDGYDTMAATSGEIALKLVSESLPDLILLDIKMPGLSGFDTLKELRKKPATQDIPVLMVTASSDVSDIINSLDLGAQDYITKPVIYPVLAARLRAALRLQDSQLELSKAVQELTSLAITDDQTTTYNRRHFFQLAEAEIIRARRYGRELSVLMLDADHFKSINDTYGHAAGDLTLQAIAEACKTQIRCCDVLARIGGEEFAIYCPDTPLQGAQRVAERICRRIENTLVHSNEDIIHVTCSIGVASLTEQDVDFATLLDRVDKLLYRAKEAGRNRIEMQ